MKPSLDATRLLWLHPAPARLVSWLRELGFDVASETQVPTLSLEPVVIEILDTTDGRGERLALAEGTPPISVDDRIVDGRAGHPNGINGVLAVGLASVDGERTIAELGEGRFERACPDQALGARAWTGLAGRPQIIVLEPSTEGRLAASLARHGERPVALYLGTTGPAAFRLGRLGRPRGWPGGPAARLVAPARPWGPFLFVVEDAGV